MGLHCKFDVFKKVLTYMPCLYTFSGTKISKNSERNFKVQVSKISQNYILDSLMFTVLFYRINDQLLITKKSMSFYIRYNIDIDIKIQ